MPMNVAFVNPTVLGHGLLICLQTREKLDAAKHPLGEVGGRAGRRSHQAVQTEGNRRAVVVHLQMDVAGGSALGLVDQFFDDFRGGNVRVFRRRNWLPSSGWLAGKLSWLVLDQIVQAVFIAHKRVETRGPLCQGLAHLPLILQQRVGNGLRHPGLPKAKAGDKAGQHKF